MLFFGRDEITWILRYSQASISGFVSAYYCEFTPSNVCYRKSKYVPAGHINYLSAIVYVKHAEGYTRLDYSESKYVSAKPEDFQRDIQRVKRAKIH
ncbi:MAG: hypothetical protein NPIRA04_21210 [Nitrospirales bacterium]|nr:MAG: hypothetical protein NPIRA04_21210 [Nitrospirales bacterium]